MIAFSQALRQIGLALFALSLFISTAVTNISLGMLLVAACIQYRDVWQSVRKQPIFYVCVLFALYVLIRQFMGFVYPGGGLSDAKAWIYLSLFWIPGWALGHQQKHWRWFLLLILVSFILRLILGFDLERISLSLEGKDRFVFHETAAALGFALYTANIILGWVVWKKQLLNRFSTRWVIIAITTIWLLVLLILLQVMVMANSRGTFLAIFLALMFLFVYAFVKSKKNTLKTAIWAIVIFSGLMAVNYDTVKERFASGVLTYQTMIQGKDLQDVPYSSSGLRIHFYVHVIDMIKQRPWFGWGAGSNQWVMQQSSDRHVKKFPHSHSGYFDVLAQLGFVGALFFVTLVILLVRGLWRARTHHHVDIEFITFLLASLILMIVWNLFNVRLEHHDYRVYSLIMLSLYFAVINKPNLEKQQHD